MGRTYLFLIIINGQAEQYQGPVRELVSYLKRFKSRYVSWSNYKVYQIGSKTKCRELSSLYFKLSRIVRAKQLSKWNSRGLLNESERFELKQLQGVL